MPPTPTSTFDGSFPSSVLGLPVVSVAEAKRLADAGDIDGRVVAVAGYFFQETPHCYSEALAGVPLEYECWIEGFADTRAGAQQCTYSKNGMSCAMPPGRTAPVFMPDSLGIEGLYASTSGFPAPVVILLHTDDPRSWECMPDHFAECQTRFVADRVAWVDGHEVLPEAREIYNPSFYTQTVATLTLDQVTQAIGPGAVVVSARPSKANDARTIEPRWNLSGDGVVWIVESVAPGDQAAGPAAATTISLVDDQTGAVLRSEPFALPSDFAPGRLWVRTSLQGFPDNDPDPLAPYVSLSRDGVDLQNGSWNEVPYVLDPGEYTVSAWLSKPGEGDDPTAPCSTDIVLSALGESELDATFTDGTNQCSWYQPSTPVFP